MPQNSKPGVNWADIKARYEAGESANRIAVNGAGVSKQAILKRIKHHGWSQDRAKRDFLARQRQWQPSVAAVQTNGKNSASLKLYHGKDTPDCRAAILAALETGATIELAAKTAGGGGAP